MILTQSVNIEYSIFLDIQEIPRPERFITFKIMMWYPNVESECSVSPLCINRHVITGITEAVYEVGVNCKEKSK
jgi:hypothetical protein